MPEHTALYAGSFDPITNGHLDVVRRVAPLFGELVVAVGINRRKPAAFSLEDRLQMLREATACAPNVRVDSFEGLLAEYAESIGAKVIVRGLRAVSDFEYETQQVLMNRRLSPGIETLFLLTNSQYSFLSSSLVKEVALLGGSVHGLVPEAVERRLLELRERGGPEDAGA
jgi:pantetheine-phosphate adenylyltransferase